MKKQIILTLLSLVILAPVIKAQTLPALTVKVDHVATTTDKLQERLLLMLKFSKQAKANYYQYLVEKRLAELTYVIENKNVNLVEELASRYSTYVGVLAQYVATNKITTKNKDLLAMFDKHAYLISELQKNFPFESGWWLAIQHDINSLKLFAAILK